MSMFNTTRIPTESKHTKFKDRMVTDATKAGGAKINKILKYNLDSVGINVHCTHLAVINVSVSAHLPAGYIQ